MIWTIVGAIIAFAAFMTTLVSLILKRIRQNTEAQTRVAVSLENVGKEIEKSNERNSEAHKEFYNRLENHETRLTVLEVNQK